MSARAAFDWKSPSVGRDTKTGIASPAIKTDDQDGYMKVENVKSNGEALACIKEERGGTTYITNLPMQLMDRVLNGKGKVGSVRRAGSGKAPITKAVRWFVNGSTSAAASAVAAVISVRPDQTNDWSSFAAIYDEVKVTRVVAYPRVYISTAGATVNTGVRWAMCYDPADVNAPTSVINTLSFQQRFGPCIVVGSEFTAVGTGTTGTIVNTVPTRLGYHRFPAKVLKRGAVRSTANVGEFGDEWSSTADTGDYFGVFKLYIEAGGTAMVTSYSIYFEVFMEFRSNH